MWLLPALPFALRAGPAPNSSSVLILDSTVTGGESSVEATEAVALGLTPVVVSGPTWLSMTAAEFATYRAIILGDPSCSANPASILAAELNRITWGAVIHGNVVVIGSDPAYHKDKGGREWTRAGIRLAADEPGETGAYITLSCGFPERILDPFGSFRVFHVSAVEAAHINISHPALTGINDVVLSNWGISVHEAFERWPSDFLVLALALTQISQFVGCDGSIGPPYIVARIPDRSRVLVSGCDRALWGDCNENGICDCEDIALGTSRDCNQNGTPDECDLTHSVDLALAARLASGIRPRSIASADFDGDGKQDLVAGDEGSPATASVFLGKGDGTFQGRTSFTTGAGTIAIVAGDLNGDGIADIATADSDSADLTVLLGNGDGMFHTAGVRPALSGHFRPWSLAAADLDADGKLDLVAGSSDASPPVVAIFLGQGDGTFANDNVGTPFAVGGPASGIAAVDMNGDGRVDLETANGSGVSILIGNGDGTFQAHRDFPAGDLSSSIAAADLNGDGKPDLATANFRGNDVSVLLGAGDGTILATRRFPVGQNPNGIAAADIDGDLKPDILTANSASDDISLLLGSGDGSLAAAARFRLRQAPGTGPQAVIPVDLNGDSRSDVAVPAYSTNDVSVFLNHAEHDCNSNGVPDECEADCNHNFVPDSCDLASGKSTDCNLNEVPDECDIAAPAAFSLTPRLAAGVHPRSIASADFDGDGKQDLVAGDEGSPATASVFLGKGDGTFQVRKSFTTGAGTIAVVAGDLNADGSPDLATVDSDSMDLTILLGNGDGTLRTSGVRPSLSGHLRPGSLAAADLDADGKLDLVAGSSEASSPVVAIFLGRGDGTFANDNVGTPFAVGGAASGIATVDMNGDGRVDLETANGSGVSVFIGNGDGTLQVHRDFPAGDLSSSIAAMDLNGDGKPDLATGNFRSNDVSVLVGTGDGAVLAPRRFLTGQGPNGVFAADIDGDLTPDLVTANSASGDVSLLSGVGDGTFAAARSFLLAGPGVPGPQAVLAADLNGDGLRDLAVPAYSTNDVWVLLNHSPRDCNQDGVPDECESPAPSITRQPASATACPGRSVGFTVEASSPHAMTYRWRKDGLDIPGAAGPLYMLAAVDAESIGSYTVVVTDGCGSRESDAAVLSLLEPVRITNSPESPAICPGAPASFSVTAEGSAPLGYQWRRNATAISGAVAATYAIGSASPSDEATYDCIASNACGEAMSAAAHLTVRDSTPPVIRCPSPITVECADENGASVDFDVNAVDDCPGPVAVVSTPASGSRFAVGTTTVSVVATDGAGNMATCRFDVVVTCAPRGGLQVPGDCNQDGTVDLSDAICVLGYLFLGKPSRLPCGDGGQEANQLVLDWNNDRTIDLSDPVGALNWLFGGAREHFLGNDCQRLAECPDACTDAR